MKNFVLYDSNCNFCKKSVNFLKRNDSKNKIDFYPLDSQIAHIELKNIGIRFIKKNTVYFIQDNKASIKSTAVLKAFAILRFPINLLSIFLIVPKFIRDAVYDLIAKNRHRF